MRKYVVLGGSGFIGRKLVSKLCKDNHVVVADLFCNPEFHSMKNVSFIQCNFTEELNFKPIIEEADAVIHLISTLFAQDGTANLITDISNNVLPTIRLLEDMLGMNTKLLFLSSGGTVYGEGTNWLASENDPKHTYCGYALTKTMIEDVLELYKHQHGFSYQTIRLSNPYGFMSSDGRLQGLIPIIIKRIMCDEPITIWGDGENIRDYIFIDDAVDAIITVLNYEGEENIFNVGHGVGYSINEIMSLIIKKLNPKNPPIIQYSAPRKCDVKKNILNIEKIKKCTGWEPKIGIEEGIDIVIREFKTINNS